VWCRLSHGIAPLALAESRTGLVLQAKVAELTERLAETTKTLEEQRAAMREMEDAVASRERELFKQHAHEVTGRHVALEDGGGTLGGRG